MFCVGSMKKEWKLYKCRNCNLVYFVDEHFGVRYAKNIYIYVFDTKHH